MPSIEVLAREKIPPSQAAEICVNVGASPFDTKTVSEVVEAH
jgi:hypothetical protein